MQAKLLEFSLVEPDSGPSPARYATAVNAEKEETASKINEKVEKMSREMRTDKKFNDGNIRELEDAKVTPPPLLGIRPWHSPAACPSHVRIIPSRCSKSRSWLATRTPESD
eukprot:COSAG04_NODE_2609_length_3859_cov_13.516223_4_plen_111_part_00